MMAALVAAVLAAGAGMLALRLYMGRAAEDILRPDERIVIAALRDPIPGNAFLACPPAYCAATATPSPVFALSAERLEAAWDAVVAGQPGVVRVAADRAQRRLVLIQHTPLLRFPDIVTIEFVALGPERSSLAVYSRARYGKGDFGANRKRVLSWLGQLERLAGQ